MHILPTTLSCLTLLASFTAALPAQGAKAKPPFFVLAGDSTTAVQSTGGGGWGDGFLNTTLGNGASGKNYGHNGATTVSFRAGGDWANVLATARKVSTDYTPYVTIQFGHNDQKPAANISTSALTANLVAFVKEARAVPATPIIVTSLSRRNYDSTGHIVENLADVTAAAKAAAQQSGADIVDLNGASTKYLNAIGADNAHTYNLNPTDNTHLNGEGSIVFGNLVAMLIDAEVPQLRGYVKPVESVEQALEKGAYIFPKV
ncbi:Esterase SGNH hydrolase-type subgroup [Pyrenophora seminiperda CCB06]|uniref:Esterase SGNH hydrolase-type subgroup n=1 Tax=Pyrenophora seminiperda CCB06 TaxID=1302712 RepID=A0A3M7M3Z2_9PLEO|nr:Esterase SGNH hydrolase-type subgroup [Pyrenophora seminiperda CCB06]